MVPTLPPTHMSLCVPARARRAGPRWHRRLLTRILTGSHARACLPSLCVLTQLEEEEATAASGPGADDDAQRAAKVQERLAHLQEGAEP